MKWLFAILLMTTPILAGEFTKRHIGGEAELHRKLVHIGASIFACFLPLFLNLRAIAFLGVVFLPTMLFLNRKYWLQSMQGTGRITYGEVFFPVGASLAALLAPQPVFFVANMLILGFADGLGGIIGKKISSYQFRVWGGKKTLAGTITVILMSFLIMGIVDYLSPVGIDMDKKVFISICVGLVEATSPYGSDNLSIPIVVGLLLRWH